MSADPRLAEERCGVTHSENYTLRAQVFLCEFAKGHKGLHFSATKRGEDCGSEGRPVAPRRWGTDAQLAEETELQWRAANPSPHVFDETTEDYRLVEALRRAIRVRGGNVQFVLGSDR